MGGNFYLCWSHFVLASKKILWKESLMYSTVSVNSLWSMNFSWVSHTPICASLVMKCVWITVFTLGHWENKTKLVHCLSWAFISYDFIFVLLIWLVNNQNQFNKLGLSQRMWVLVSLPQSPPHLYFPLITLTLYTSVKLEFATRLVM